MNSEEKSATVVAGDPPPRVGDEGDGVSKDLGIKEPGVVTPPAKAAPLDASETNGGAKESSVGRHERNGSMSGAFLAAPGYSPSFASLGDTNSFESHHAPRYSDTFEGFEAPRLSNSQEIQETPKVTRPEGLSFITPEAKIKTPEIIETPQASDAGTGDFGTPVSVTGEQWEKQTAEDHTSPIANLVEKHPADVAAPSPSTPTELVPALGKVDSFSFGGPSTTPEKPNEPYITPKKIPGHELLNSIMTTNKPFTPLSPKGLHGVNDVSSPAVEAGSSAPSHSDVALPKEALNESEPVVPQPKPNAVEIVQPDVHETPLPEEPALAIPPSEKLDSNATDSPIVHTADASTTEKAVVASNVATGSEGKIEEVEENITGREADSTGVKEAGSAKSPETFEFRNVEREKEVSTSITSETPKPGPFKKLTNMSTKKWRSTTDADLKTMVLIPEYLSKDMTNAVATKGAATPEGPLGKKVEAPTCPVLVFINSKSGGRLGPELMEHFEELISPNQVYDLAKHSPSAVLRYGVGCLDRMAASGDEVARQTRKNLRILVAGGDGTVGWCLSSVGALRELSGASNIPPVGVIPLGTGNDLSRSFGWGGEFSSTSKSTLKRVLVKALNSKAAPLDTWNAVVIPAKSVAADDIQFPHAMHPQHHVPLPSSVAGEKHDKDETAPAFEGLFFNYFSVGMDAQVAYGFHHLRDEKPWLARGRTANQMIYSSFGCTQGWFCTACSMAPRARGVSNILKLSVRKRGSKDWQDIHLPSNIRAVVICNLQSYAGGRNPWGKPSSGRRQKEGFEEQRPDDGLLEIMGLKDGWHSAFVLLEVSTAVRLCQAEAVKLELNGNARKKAYLQMDGEPWMQPMGTPNDEPTVVMIDKLPHPSLLLKR